ncbi:MAG: hypothetical protein WCS51_04860 [Bacilli bacterium]|jgi:hypothetical protein
MKSKRIKVVKKIGLYVDEASGCYSKFSYEDNHILDTEFIDYVERNAHELGGVDLDKYEIDIYSPFVISNNQKEIFLNTYKRHYEQMQKDAEKEVHRCNIRAGILFLAGAVILAARGIIASTWTNAPEIIDFVLEIASWVFMWESVDVMFFSRNQSLLNKVFYEHMYNADFSFIYKEKKSSKQDDPLSLS